MLVSNLDGRKVLVVGASRGIGLGIGQACAAAGAAVTLAARSADKLAAAAEAGGDNTYAVTCDVRDESSCLEAVRAASDHMGGIDALVYATGMSICKPVGELILSELQTVFETNVFGAALMTSAALKHLEASSGHALYLTSESATYRPTPWRGIGGYIASKRAMESLVESFTLEHPTVAFTNVVVGATVTEFGSEDPDSRIEEFIPEWMERGYVCTTDVLWPADHAQVVMDILSLPQRVLIDRVGVRVRGAH